MREPAKVPQATDEEVAEFRCYLNILGASIGGVTVQKLLELSPKLLARLEAVEREVEDLRIWDCRRGSWGAVGSGSQSGYTGPTILSSAPLTEREVQLGQEIAKKYGLEEKD